MPMHKDSPPLFKNSVLASLPPSELAQLRPFLRPTILKERCVLQEQGKRIERVHFVETGLVSLRTIGSGTALETAMAGSYGLVEATVAFGIATSLHQSVVVIPGNAYSIDVNHLHRSMADWPDIGERVRRYAETMISYISQTAFCAIHHTPEQRLACWICFACDALNDQVIPITQDSLSFMLGLRRPSVTEALIRFQQDGLLAKSRGVFEVRDRHSLKLRACDCYKSLTKLMQPR
jgi:CRP-like cAMP-binding protein